MFHINSLRVREYALKKSFELSIVRLFFTFSFAILETIWAIYMNSFGLSNSEIGFINAIILIIGTLFLFSCTNILAKFSERKSFIISSIISIIILLLIPLNQNLYLFLIYAVILILSKGLKENSFNILFRDNIEKSNLNESEALLSVLGNIAWFIGPILTGFLFLEYGFEIVFYSSAAFVLISLILFSKVKIPKIKTKKYEKKSIPFLIKNIIEKKQTHLPYFLSMGISLWWGFIFIYVPLFIIESRLGNEYIGIFIGLSQLPLIFVEYYAGKKSAKDGFKKLFICGFLGVSVVAFICFLVEDILIKLILLVFASFFMALIEPLRYSYIFSKIQKKDEEDIIPIFSSSLTFGSLIGKISVALILLFLATSYAYLIMSIFMFGFFILSLKIKE